jgi:hypothetical protein
MESMSASGDLSLLDLHDFPDSQPEILHFLVCHGPQYAFNLVQSASLDPVDGQQAIDVLIDEGHNRCLTHGRINTLVSQIYIQITRQDQLWLELLAPNAEIDHQVLQEACYQ